MEGRVDMKSRVPSGLVCEHACACAEAAEEAEFGLAALLPA
jgi:hypothetical protein